MKDPNKILLDVQRFLHKEEQKLDYSVPSRALTFYAPEFLSHVETGSCERHEYEDAIIYWGNLEKYPITVKHGHPYRTVCYANEFCHEATYRPLETDNPTFRKLFQQKWGY